MTTTLTVKDFRVRLKQHWTIQDFCTHYGMTEDSLMTAIDKAYPVKRYAEEVKQELRANSKKANKKQKNVLDKIETAPAEEATEHLVSEEVIQTNSSTTTTPVVDAINDVAPTTETSLEQLQKEEKSLSDTLRKLKVEHKELISTRAHCANIMREKDDELFKIREMFKLLEEQFNSEVVKYESYTTEIKRINSEISDVSKLLEETRTAILKNQKVIIYILSDGNIEFENYDFEYSQFSLVIEELSHKFFLDSRFETLRALEIKQLAKLIILTQELRSKGRLFELMFDSLAIEEKWNQL